MDAGHLNQTSTSTSCTVESSLEKHMYPAAYSLFFIVGFPANCLSLYVAWMLMRNGNSTAVYLVNLSISDLLYTISLPVWIELALLKPLGSLCSLVAVIMHNSFYVGSGLLCCISFDRYLALVYPLHFHWVREVRTAAAIVQSLRQSVSILAEERRKVGLMLLFLLLTYIVAFVPYQTVMLLRAILEPGVCVYAVRLRDPYLVTVAMTTINSTLDPIIYCLISESAQKEIRKALEKGRAVFIRRIWSESSSGIQSVS
ncbi:G-protein coupled receptor 4-like isoform X2 [Siniperca chuatsi]|uniref:G-protein coupled receptor 4-like isoform X2 n=1 Tax=Siniperca chuatsi TaxID=119488 RepID=UPI001CE0C21D|nr:G-protein coupled receptor 4-like isoform X2 [Siniperca chuatsi]